jgi:ribosomal protein S10
MTIVTKLTLRSGDRTALDGVVHDIRDAAQRKGAELKGPHSEPPETLRVAQPKRLTGEGGSFDDWGYTVYSRRVELHGHEALARSLIERDYPSSIRVEAEMEQIRAAGR